MTTVKDNPVYELAKKRQNEYGKILKTYEPRIKNLLKKYKPVPVNQTFIQKWLFSIAGNAMRETQRLLVHSIEEAIEETLYFYNDLHKGQAFTEGQLETLFMDIRKDFLLSKFKGATVDERLQQAEGRLRVNLQRELINLVDGPSDEAQDPTNLINTITGRGQQYGGTAYRWNSRLILSEIFRAYQFTARRILKELKVKEVFWVNSPRQSSGNGTLEEYAEQVYTPSTLPEYPYPCNDSYFLPNYKEE